MKKIVFLFILLTGLFAIAQKNIDPTPEDIKLAKSLRVKYDKSDIVILKSEENVSFAINKSINSVEVNYKINENLMNINHRADISKYEFYDSESEIKTFSIKYRNNKTAAFYPKDEFYKSNDLFYNDAKVKHVQLDFPVQGYSYDYEMEKEIRDIKYFTSIYFNDEYPVIEKTITIKVPKWLELEIKEFNFNSYDIKKTTTPDGDNKIYKYVIKNMDPSVKENNAPGPSYLYPHVLFIAKSYTEKTEKKTLFNSTADLYKWYKSLVDSMKDEPAIFANKVKELTKDAKTDDEKIKNIYYWVQDNIRYIAFEDGIAGFKPDDSQNVFEKRYGDCKGMANLTKQMLKLAGFDARLTWIGTNHIAYDYSIPSLSVDNHMICTLIKDGKKYFLDGTEKFNSFGEYAERIQGKEVLIEDGNKFIIDKVPVQKSITNSEKIITNYKIENENLTGSVNKEFIGESRATFLYQYNNVKNDKKEDALKWFLSGNDKNYNISNIITSDLSNRDQKLNISYETKLANHVSSFDNEMYVDLDYDKEYKYLDLKERKKDIMFDYKSHDDITIILEIPTGYKVSRLPTNFEINNEDYTISLKYEVKGNTIIYHKMFDFKKPILKSSKFEEWKKNHLQFTKNYSEQIVLTK
ncbi:transglutaminase-like domain-containing protein [uncultured Flavobacterium sp.]|uniref:transglutaminase-like domain-containing protein n=1 Tax=uncultured Flavobacterium sp. TaxID=165435 RepID=UPI0030EB7550|tara:strand:+ start:51646 stop:53553 length:1908 start_codon:yes stop_codon:yes gene_type:complete